MVLDSVSSSLDEVQVSIHIANKKITFLGFVVFFRQRTLFTLVYPMDVPKNVAGRKACVRPAHSRWSRVKYRGKGRRKFLAVHCPRGTFRHGLTDRCYSCPRGYRRTVFHINSKKGCEKVIRARFTRATKRGKVGCHKGYFQHGLTNRCYQCPRGYKRSLVLAKDPSKHRRACERVKITPPRNFQRIVKARFAWLKKLLRGKNGRIVKQAIAKIRKFKVSTRFARMSNGQKRAEIMKVIKKARLVQILSPLARKNIRNSGTKANDEACSSNSECASGRCHNKYCRETDTFKTFTGSVALDIGVSMISLEAAFTAGGRLPWVSQGSSIIKSYFEFYAGVGLTGGADLALDFGLFIDTNENLSGQLWGATLAATKGIGASISLWFRCAKKNHCFAGSENHPNGFQFVGIQIGPQVGLGAELEFGIVTSWSIK